MSENNNMVWWLSPERHIDELWGDRFIKALGYEVVVKYHFDPLDIGYYLLKYSEEAFGIIITKNMSNILRETKTDEERKTLKIRIEQQILWGTAKDTLSFLKYLTPLKYSSIDDWRFISFSHIVQNKLNSHINKYSDMFCAICKTSLRKCDDYIEHGVMICDVCQMKEYQNHWLKKERIGL